MSALEVATAQLLTPAGLTVTQLEDALATMLSHQVDLADVYLQSTQHESWMLEDGIVKEGNYSHDCGAGLRAISGERTGFAYSDELSVPALQQAAKAARSIAQHGGDGKVQAWQQRSGHSLYQPIDPLGCWDKERKVQLLRSVDAQARQLDPRVKQVVVSLSGVYESMLVLNTAGTYSGDIRPLVRFNISVIVEENGRREQASSGGGGRTDYHYFTEERVFGYAQDAVRQALVNLEAIAAPAGSMPVVLGPGWPGVLLHEAVGHGLEGDFNRKGSSAYAGRIGERVASAHCTIVDDGTLTDRRGSLNIDDEGHPTQQTVLIENGTLKGYMQDQHNAKLSGVASTGNGRRESYAHLPMPRMTNTYMLPGQHDPAEIIASVDKGLYAVNFGGGQVDITSGQFVFSASEAYLIENGRVTQPVKGATLIGNGPAAMNQVSMVGNDLALDTGIGVCGKEGQSVPVGVGQPTLKIDQITVGGTQ